MALIKWQPQFNLGIESIDQQHRMLANLINDLYQAFTSKKDRQTLSKHISQLGIYAAMHFAREEHYFKLINYPESDLHEKEHDAFDEKVSHFEEKFKTGKQNLTLEVLHFLVDWLLHHINVSDRKYAPFLKKNGIH